VQSWVGASSFFRSDSWSAAPVSKRARSSSNLQTRLLTWCIFVVRGFTGPGLVIEQHTAAYGCDQHVSWKLVELFVGTAQYVATSRGR